MLNVDQENASITHHNQSNKSLLSFKWCTNFFENVFNPCNSIMILRFFLPVWSMNSHSPVNRFKQPIVNNLMIFTLYKAFMFDFGLKSFPCFTLPSWRITPQNLIKSMVCVCICVCTWKCCCKLCGFAFVEFVKIGSWICICGS